MNTDEKILNNILANKNPAHTKKDQVQHNKEGFMAQMQGWLNM